MPKYETGYKSDVLRYALTCAINDRLAYLVGLKEAKQDHQDDDWINTLIEETRAEIRDFTRLQKVYY